MKQIIPFKKELLFKTKVSEITSISLEHTLSLKSDDLISGFFQITGDYKMTEGSINREKFEFKLPFDIALDSRYNLDSIIIDIDNFYYEIINNESLQVNIDVYVEGEKIIEETLKEEKSNEVFSTKEQDKELRNTYQEDEALFKEEYKPSIEANKIESIILNEEKESLKEEFNLFDKLDNTDTYVTYYVYIVKEEDTLDKILTKYNTTKESISIYNDIENIKPGTKLIIPSTYNE